MVSLLNMQLFFFLKKRRVRAGHAGTIIIPALESQEQEDHIFEASMSYIVRLWKEKKKTDLTIFILRTRLVKKG